MIAENNESASGKHWLDARGLLCPEPVMLLHKKMRELNPGDKVTVVATDPTTQRDFARFCEFLPHSLLKASQQGLSLIHI